MGQNTSSPTPIHSPEGELFISQWKNLRIVNLDWNKVSYFILFTIYYLVLLGGPDFTAVTPLCFVVILLICPPSSMNLWGLKTPAPKSCFFSFQTLTWVDDYFILFGYNSRVLPIIQLLHYHLYYKSLPYVFLACSMFYVLRTNW